MALERIAWTGIPPASRASGVGRLLLNLVAQLRSSGLVMEEIPFSLAAGGSPAERHRRVVAHLLAAWRTARPDLLHLELPGSLAHAALAAAEAAGIPATGAWHHVHLHAPAEQRERTLELSLALLRRCRRTFCYTPADAAWLAAHGISDAMPRLTGVDRRLFTPAAADPRQRAAWGAGADDPVVLTACRLVPAKSLDLLVASVRALRMAVPRARWVVAGEGPERPALASEPGLVLLGHREGDLPSIFATADLFAFPSRDEPLGVVVAEALASGTPVAAFARGAAGLLVRDGATGALAPCGDDGAFVARVVALAGDLPRLRAMRAACPEAISGWTWEAVAARYRTVWQQVAATGSRPAP